MRQGRDQVFGRDYERCLKSLDWAIAQLDGKPDPEQLAITAELIIQTMSGPWRYFHTSEHIFEVGGSGDEIEILAALFHDLVYVQVDQGVSVNISRRIAPFVKEIDGQLVILSGSQLLPDRVFDMVAQIFGFAPGQTLQPTAGQNEFLSALIGAKCLEHALPLPVIAQVVACIEATIPFRGRSESGQTAGERLRDRLSVTNEQFELGWREEDLHSVVRRAIRLANRDVENFAYISSAEFLDNTWNLMPETNHDLISANSYTVSGYRLSLQKMEGFMYFLKPELVFQRYLDEPDIQTYKTAIHRTQKNLEVARLYLGSKLLSIAVIEALSQRLGQDIPLATMMGELPGRGLSTAQLESFLPAVSQIVLPTTPLEYEVLELLEKGRSKSSSYDVKNSPVATYIIKSLGFPESQRLLVQAKEYFKRNLSGEAFLSLCDRDVVHTIIQAVLKVFERRINAIGNSTLSTKV
jgi:hypothetical protein